MKTVGMITIYRKNYGAFLQAYALQQTLKKLGYAPEIIRYNYYKDHTMFGVSLASKPSMKQLLKAALVETVRYIPHKQRQKIFDESIKNNLIESKEYYKTYEELKNAPPQYDVYLTGSDQVFNGAISPQALPARLLSFVREGKKASYAASAGGIDFEEEYLKYIIDNLRLFDKVSVREEELEKTLLKKYSLKSICNVDPVFLLDGTEWGTFSKEVTGLEGKYIFLYRVLPQPQLAEIAAKISEEYNLPVFVADGHEKFINQIEYVDTLSPEQWVYALNNAAIVVTNSFHGTAFAVNLNKNAYVMIPPKGGERVRNLLDKCGLIIGSNSELKSLENREVYSRANQYIKSERKRSYEFLQALCE